MSKRFVITTPVLELALTYTQGLLEPVSEEVRVLYTALQRLHEGLPMESLAFSASTVKGWCAFRAVTRAGSSWRQTIVLDGGPDKDPPMTYNVSAAWRPSESAPVAAVRDALLVIRNRHGLDGLIVRWPSTVTPSTNVA